MIRTASASPRLKARIGGGFYIIVIILGVFDEAFVRGQLIVWSDAAATAHNILANEPLYRLGFAAGIVLLPCNMPLAVIFYDLFKVVNRNVALLVALFIVIGTAIEGVSLLGQFAPLILLSGADHLSAFDAHQLQGLALASLRLQAVAYDISLAFFGLYDLLIGYLIFRSTFLPWILGLLMATAGLCYLTNSFAVFLAPGLAAHLFPYILAPSGVAELALSLWLIAIGVNEPKWHERARAAMDAAQA
jgi:hypothetical protein